MPSSSQRAGQLVGGLLVGARGEVVTGMHDGHLRAEAGERLAELEPDGPAADDEQRLGQLGQLERRHVVDPVDVVDALDRRDRSPRAGGDQDPLGRQLLVVHPHGVCGDELGLAVVGVVALLAELLHPFLLWLLQRVLARLDAGEVDAGGTDVDADDRREAVDVVDELGDDEVGLGRLARHVRAAAAPARALDQGHLGAVLL